MLAPAAGAAVALPLLPRRYATTLLGSWACQLHCQIQKRWEYTKSSVNVATASSPTPAWMHSTLRSNSSSSSAASVILVRMQSARTSQLMQLLHCSGEDGVGRCGVGAPEGRLR